MSHPAPLHATNFCKNAGLRQVRFAVSRSSNSTRDHDVPHVLRVMPLNRAE